MKKTFTKVALVLLALPAFANSILAASDQGSVLGITNQPSVLGANGSALATQTTPNALPVIILVGTGAIVIGGLFAFILRRRNNTY